MMDIYNILVLGWIMPLLTALITEIKNYINSILYKTIYIKQDIPIFKEIKFFVTNHALNITSLEFCSSNLSKKNKLLGCKSNIPYSIYEGKYYIKINGIMCTIILEKDDKKISISCFSWKSFKPIYDIIALAKKEYDIEYNNSIMMYTQHYESWCMNKTIQARKLSSIILDENIINSVITKIDNFNNNIDFYNKIGVPYKLCLLLKGKAGTGKTSLCNVLAGYYKKNLYIFDPLITPAYFDLSIKAIASNSIVLIEDLDRAFSAVRNNADGNEIVEWKAKFDMAKFLNFLDGANSKEGLIIIITVNNTDVFPEALLRSGRIDLEVNIGYCTKKMLKQYINMFYDKCSNKKILDKIANKLYTNNLTLSKVQQYLLNFIDEPENALMGIEKKI
jgi:hypothetical protein